MKNRLGQRASMFVRPPDETLRDDVTARHSAAASSDEARLRQPHVKAHDRRFDVAFGEALQRVRARQMEPRTAVDCHVRTRRRPRPEPE